MKLDALLRYLHDAFWESRNGIKVENQDGKIHTSFGIDTEYRPVVEIHFELMNQFNDENIDYSLLISRLEKRNFVKSKSNGALEIQYAISEDGKEFLLNGGFRKEEQLKSDAAELGRFQKNIAEWQSKWGNKIAVSSIVTSIMSLIATSLIAIYLKGRPTPIYNYVPVNIDSSFWEKTRSNTK